jgi:hypothetical protein
MYSRNICDAKEHLIVEERVTRLASDEQDIICLEDDEDLLPMRIRCGEDTYRCPIRKVRFSCQTCLKGYLFIANHCL